MSVLSAEQIAQLLACCRERAAGHGRLVDGNDDARLYDVAVATGLRLGELLGLRWSDVDFDGRRLAVQRAAKYVGVVVTLGPTKTAKSRRAIALSAST